MAVAEDSQLSGGLVGSTMASEAENPKGALDLYDSSNVLAKFAQDRGGRWTQGWLLLLCYLGSGGKGDLRSVLALALALATAASQCIQPLKMTPTHSTFR